MKNEFALHRLDVKAFAEEAGRWAGREPAGRFHRLMEAMQGCGAQAPVIVSAQGGLRNPGHVQPQVWLQLRVQAVLPMTCQRCLGPIDVAVGLDRSFRFVADETTAAEQDDESEEDVLVLSPSFDLMELVEDELLMELPLAPRHGDCPAPVILAVADAEFAAASLEGAHPFAVLQKRKSGES